MVDKQKVKERIERGDGSVAPHHLAGEPPAADSGRVHGEGKMTPHDRESRVGTTIDARKLVCPQCGKSTLHAEFPDHYEAWTKCSNCGFFMGMSNEEWHKMESSHNLKREDPEDSAQKRVAGPPALERAPGLRVLRKPGQSANLFYFAVTCRHHAPGGFPPMDPEQENSSLVPPLSP